MTNEVSSLSRVYKFLSQKADWAAEADGNGDGAITKAEFSKYLKENFEWNGEEDSQKTDLINSFWKSIDTNKSTAKIKGTRVRNNNALDKKEQEAMSYRLEMYETLNTFMDGIKAPTVLSSKYATQWKTSVDTSLSNITETAIKGKKTTEELQALLEEQAPLVQTKATADYCATEYLETTMKTISQKYSYAYGDDSTLKGIIDAYVQSLQGSETATDMKTVVQNIIDAYLATAGLAEDNGTDLSQYGYVQNQDSELNDLQKCVAKKALQDNLASIKDEADYADYSSYYDEAVNAYIESVLTDATFATYEKIQTYGVEQFKATDTYKDLEMTVKIKKFLTSDDLAELISDRLDSSLAEKVQKDGRYLPAYTEITEQLIEKAKAGDFNNADGLDMTKLQNWFIAEIENRIADFYNGDLSDMSLKSMKKMYDNMAKAADNETDNDKSLQAHRDAALKYCNAIAAKSTSLKAAVVEIFGSDWESTINGMLPSELAKKINKLQTQATEIGDIKEMTQSEKNALIAGINDNYTFGQGTTVNNVQAAQNATCQGKAIGQDRIKYSSTGNISIDDSGKVSFDTSKAGTYTGTITISIDGQKVISKTITYTIKKTNASLANTIGNDCWGGDSSHLEVYGLPGVGDGKVEFTTQSFADLYNNNAVIMLHMGKGNGTHTGTINERLTNLCGFIVNALASKGLDSGKLQNASKKVIATLMSNYYRKGSSDDNTEGVDLGTRVSQKIKNGEMTGVVKFTDFKKKDYQVNMVSFKEVVDLILNEYGY